MQKINMNDLPSVPKEKYDKPKDAIPNLTKWLGAILFILSIIIGWIGYSHTLSGIIPGRLVDIFYPNISTDLATIAITILIIDTLSERREIRTTKARLIRDLGSEYNAFALRALVELRANNWLEDGTLKGAHLRSANLHHANLHQATLPNAYLRKAIISQAYLGYANLRNVDFAFADLQGSSFEWADLSESILIGAKLEGAKFDNANLKGAQILQEQLARAGSLKGATMPDGTSYEIWSNQNGFNSTVQVLNESKSIKASNNSNRSVFGIIGLVFFVIIAVYQYFHSKK